MSAGGVALVTGGSGYLGAVVVQQLHEQGRRVRVLDLADADDRPADVELALGDICDRDVVRRALDDVDVVFHNVAQVPLARDRELFRAVNVDGTALLLDECERAGVRKVVSTSSSAVFGVPGSNPVTRSTEPAPGEAYGRAKLAAEQLCRAAVSRGLDVSVVRPRTIVGPGRLGIFAILFDWIADGVDVPVLGRGDNRYQFVHADDLAAACLLAAGRPGSATYNVGAEEFGTMRETLEALCRHAGTGSQVLSVPVAPATTLMRGTAALGATPFGAYHWLMYAQPMWFDLTEANTELGWRARHTTDDAFREAYDWFLANRAGLHDAGGSAHRRPVRQGVLGAGKAALRLRRAVRTAVDRTLSR